jgi:hypothetical protein
MNKPTLMFHNDEWQLRLSFDEQYSLTLRIIYAFRGERHQSDDMADWNHYCYQVSEEGESWEYLTAAQWSERMQAIEENEGCDAATQAAARFRCAAVDGDTAPYKLYVAFEELRKHWEAMLTLGFTPAVTMKNGFEVW